MHYFGNIKIKTVFDKKRHKDRECKRMDKGACLAVMISGPRPGVLGISGCGELSVVLERLV